METHHIPIDSWSYTYDSPIIVIYPQSSSISKDGIFPEINPPAMFSSRPLSGSYVPIFSSGGEDRIGASLKLPGGWENTVGKS